MARAAGDGESRGRYIRQERMVDPCRDREPKTAAARLMKFAVRDRRDERVERDEFGTNSRSNDTALVKRLTVICRARASQGCLGTGIAARANDIWQPPLARELFRPAFLTHFWDNS